MTEGEAKTKVCVIRLIGKPEFDEAKYCIGSGCAFGCDAAGNWRGHCGLVPPPPLNIKFVGELPQSRRVGKGVYSNPQPGDADHGK